MDKILEGQTFKFPVTTHETVCPISIILTRQCHLIDMSAVGANNSPLNNMFQLPHIARPIVVHKLS